jgi:hypothetical protein
MYCGQDFDVIQPDEVDDFTVDFVNDLKSSELILAARAWLYVARSSLGIDSNPMSHVMSGVNITGTMATVKLGNQMVDGVLYGLEIQVMTNFNNQISLWSHIPCQQLDWAGTQWMSALGSSRSGSNVVPITRIKTLTLGRK